MDKKYWFISEKGIKADYCYFIVFNKWMKIGSTTNLVSRFNQIRFSLPEECELIAYFKTKYAYAIEQYFIRNLTDYESTRGEWVLYNEEQFKLCVSIITIGKDYKLITNA